MISRLVERELERTDWAELRVIDDAPAQEIPNAVRGLLAATSEDEAKRWYWQLDNWCVVQGQLYDSAVPLVSVLLAALAGPIAPVARIPVADVLVEILRGESDPSEARRGNADLGQRARERARPGVWLAYALAADGDAAMRERAIFLYEAIDIEDDRVDAMLQVAESDDCPRVRELASELIGQRNDARSDGE